jgi:hypothetical protein
LYILYYGFTIIFGGFTQLINIFQRGGSTTNQPCFSGRIPMKWDDMKWDDHANHDGQRRKRKLDHGTKKGLYNR